MKYNVTEWQVSWNSWKTSLEVVQEEEFPCYGIISIIITMDTRHHTPHHMNITSSSSISCRAKETVLMLNGDNCIHIWFLIIKLSGGGTILSDPGALCCSLWMGDPQILGSVYLLSCSSIRMKLLSCMTLLSSRRSPQHPLFLRDVFLLCEDVANDSNSLGFLRDGFSRVPRQFEGHFDFAST